MLPTRLVIMGLVLSVSGNGVLGLNQEPSGLVGVAIAQPVQRQATYWTAKASLPAGARDISFLHSVRNGSGTHPASYLMGTGHSLLGVKWSGA
jgi:hypothetical protein